MRRYPFVLVVTLLLTGMGFATKNRPESFLKSTGLAQLENRLQEIDNELEKLAGYSLRSGVGAVGYQSLSHKQPDSPEWVRIDLGALQPIDQIILAPTIGRDSKTGLQAEGFPLEFRILAGAAHTTNVVASFTAQDGLLPRIAPLVVSIDPVTASWVCVESARHSSRRWDQLYALQLSEIMIFSGMKNVALQQPVEASSSYRRDGARHERFLVDGFVPYLMDAAYGDKSPSLPFYTYDKRAKPTLTVDLGALFPVDQISLHSIDLSQTIPEAATDGFATPRHFCVTGSNRPDFENQTLLFDYARKSIYEAGPVITRNIPETTCRYVRITALEIGTDAFMPDKRRSFGFAEIEIFSAGQNVALGRPVTPGANLKGVNPGFNRMTDGNNFFGKILPVRDWMGQLARRHDLETERPLVAAELNLGYTRQQALLRHMRWLAALLTAGIGFTILIERFARQQQVARIKQRFAADLHDELSANVHSIGMLSDLAQDAQSPKEWEETSRCIMDLAKQTTLAIRHCTNLIEAKGLYLGLVKDMKWIAQRISDSFEHTFSIDGEQWIDQLNPRNSIDLFLFYKECLINICRHANATQICTILTATPKTIQLTVKDNGQGIDQVPTSLERRAHLLKAKLSIEAPPEGGTIITLQFRRRHKFRNPKIKLNT